MRKNKNLPAGTEIVVIFAVGQELISLSQLKMDTWLKSRKFWYLTQSLNRKLLRFWKKKNLWVSSKNHKPTSPCLAGRQAAGGQKLLSVFYMRIKSQNYTRSKKFLNQA